MPVFIAARGLALPVAFAAALSVANPALPQLDGENLDGTRPPVSESELGDAQYYRLPARSFRLGLGFRF